MKTVFRYLSYPRLMVSLLQTDRIERLARPRGNVKAIEFWSVLKRIFTRAAKAEGEEASVADDPVRCRAAATFQKRRFTC
jgi:hypothetical protein